MATINSLESFCSTRAVIICPPVINGIFLDSLNTSFKVEGLNSPLLGSSINVFNVLDTGISDSIAFLN